MRIMVRALKTRPGNGGSGRLTAALREEKRGGGQRIYPNRIRALDTRGLNTQVFAASGVGYEIADGGRTRRNFGLVAGLVAAADRHLTKHTLGQLREFCRMHDRQSTLFSGILDRALHNIFGANFDFVPQTGESELDKRAKDYIAERMTKEKADAEGKRDLAEIAQAGVRAVWNDGDILLAKRRDGSLLAYEADQMETPSEMQRPGGRRVVLGVELDDVNRPRRFCVKKRLTKNDYGNTEYAGEKYQWIPAHQAIWPAYRKRFHQTRGVPFLAVILGTFDRTNNYLDYESLAAEGNSMLGWQIIKEPDDTAPPGEEDNPDTGSNFDKLQKMEPFMVFDLGTGEEIKTIANNRPGDNFESYLITCCRIIGVGVGLPLELLLLDFSRTNYSSARASLSEGRRMFRVWQKWAAQHICLPWHRWQIDRGIAAGELPADPRLYLTRCQWPAWEYIDPVKENQGSQIAISFAGKSISEYIRERGREPLEVFDELENDVKTLKEKGINLDISSLRINTILSTEPREDKP